MPWTIRIALVIAAVLLGTSAAGLWSLRDEPPIARPEELRLAVTPNRDAAALRRVYEPILRHVAARTGIACTLVIPRDYQDLVERFDSGGVDLGWFGALVFLRARDAAGARPVAMRDVDARMTTVFVARAEGEGLRLDDFRGKRLALGSALSTSAHLMARDHLLEHDLDPASSFASVEHAATHSDVVRLVLEGEADLGAVNGVILDRMIAESGLSASAVTIIARTEPYVDYVWAARPSINLRVIKEVRDALLELDPNDAEQGALLERHGCRGYLPTTAKEFEPIERVARRLGLLGASP